MSKCLACAISREAVDIISPLQVGAGIRGGTETVVHAVRFIQESIHIDPSRKATLLLDFSNAFNSISWKFMLTEIRSQLSGLFAWFQYCYISPSFLFFSSHTIEIHCGVQQGDLLGALGFSLSLHLILEQI